MAEPTQRTAATGTSHREETIAQLRESVESGDYWAVALFRAMAMWADPDEVLGGRRYRYFIGGEAFDRLLLAERLLREIRDLVPDAEAEDFLFRGVLPGGIDEDRVQGLLGVAKYRGHLNFHYGVTVEETLQLAVEQEVIKRHASNGLRYPGDVSEEACAKIYGAVRAELAAKFRLETGTPADDPMSLSECKEFTYWLFKLRLWRSDKPRIASDTKKGLDQLHRMKQAARLNARQACSPLQPVLKRAENGSASESWPPR